MLQGDVGLKNIAGTEVGAFDKRSENKCSNECLLRYLLRKNQPTSMHITVKKAALLYFNSTHYAFANA
jgi:hypothetical protein